MPYVSLRSMASKKKLKRRIKELQQVVDALIERATNDIEQALTSARETKTWCVQCEGYCEAEEPC